MTDVNDNSSLPLLLSITGAILLVAGGGWYLLNQDPVTTTPDFAAAPTAEATLPDTGEVVQEAADDAAEPVVEPDVDAELRKARLAADADILVLPASQSALYYYGRVLEIDPQNAVALAERDAILARSAQIVQRHLDAEEYDEAYEIAVLVARQEPEHQLVVDTQVTLDSLTEELVAEAVALAQDGKDDEARQGLARAQSLPGRNPDYFAAVRDSIEEIRTVRLAAERDRSERAKLANTEARAAWVDRINSAIAAGNLISPAGASARDLLSESNSWDTERADMTAAFLSAATDTAQQHVDNRLVADAEALLDVAEQIAGDAGDFQYLRAALEELMIDVESKRVANMKELVRLKSFQPKYPERARKREQSGWVDVYFTVTTEGNTAAIEVSQSEPETVFDRAAIAAVEKWKFEPVEYRGRIIDQRAAARLVFRLE
ncbi:MAG: energy transducer TonB [Gammaproteobacteria bacterium]|nr:energy transducer TonB [Gammaproteobacteria bacterium]